MNCPEWLKRLLLIGQYEQDQELPHEQDLLRQREQRLQQLQQEREFESRWWGKHNNDH